MEDYRVKVNWGTIPSIPEVSVNKFPPNVAEDPKWDQLFFLTHYDPKIMTEVLNLDFLKSLSRDGNHGARLFLHELMYEYLLFWTQTTFVQNRKMTLEMLQKLKDTGRIVCCKADAPFEIHCAETMKIIRVTLLPGGYDVGCVMILFSVRSCAILDEVFTFRILHTGNCRVSLKDLNKNPFLCQNGKMLEIHQLFLDTTYLHQEITELALRNDTTTELIDAIKDQLDNNPELHLEFTKRLPGVMGRMFYNIAEEICQPVHVPRALADFCVKIPGLFGRVTGRCDPELRVHFGCCELTNNKLCSDRDWKTSVDVMKLVLCQEICRLPASEHSRQPKLHGRLVYAESGIPVSMVNTKRHSGSDRILSENNAHLSRFEMGRMIRLLDVPISEGTIFPLYRAKDETVENMIELLRSTVAEMPRTEPREYLREPFAYSYDFTVQCLTPFPDAPIAVYHFDPIKESRVALI